MAVTWNPLDVGSTVILSNENLTLQNVGGYHTGNGRANLGISSGKKYWEIHWDDGVYLATGVANNINAPSGSWSFSGNARIYAWDGKIYPGGTTYGVATKIGDTIGVALDMDAGTLGFYINGVYKGIASTDILTFVGTTVYPYVVSGDSNYFICTANFGATPFAYPIPDGYTALDGGEPTTIDVSITPIIASATSQAIIPAISATRNITINSIIATSTSQAKIPTISTITMINANITAKLATSTSEVKIPIIIAELILNTTIPTVIANSTSKFIAPLISTIRNEIAKLNLSEKVRKQIIKNQDRDISNSEQIRYIRTEVI